MSAIVSRMTLDEKLSQMIIPAIRTWNDREVTDLDEAPDLKEALKKHQYGGIILFGQNIKDTEQTVKLVSGLQANNLANEGVSVHIPYLMPLDEEGGIVIRLTDGTRMTGNMAIGATGDAAEGNAFVTGRIIGEELSALGFNADFAPVVDVNNNAANPVIGVRSFSDDPRTVAALGTSYMDGLTEVNIAAACKHFPGHGDTDVDSHIGTPTVKKTYEELLQTELVPFEAMTGHGVDMVMTAHITFPKIDDKVTYSDGTEGYYPATMSKKIITDILRGDLRYDGVVVTDALEMDAIMNSALVDGEPQSTEYMVNIAEKVINAGVDILLIPKDLKDAGSAKFYDDYISGLEAKVENGAIPVERIDESVERILKLKEKHGIVESAYSDHDIEESIKNAKSVVGSGEHHKVEMQIARSAVTVLKNDGNTLPLSQDADSVFLLSRVETDRTLVESTMSALKDEGVISPDTEVLFDYYIESDKDGEKLHYTEEMADGIRNADVVIGMTRT
ncbi:MAG: glycoside hydrolase family 3 protein, partial [Lachnospiraceae bacterium]|nr:glycoside hydrolase family 3 protein [Lachnospiraceae bacterium]